MAATKLLMQRATKCRLSQPSQAEIGFAKASWSRVQSAHVLFVICEVVEVGILRMWKEPRGNPAAMVQRSYIIPEIIPYHYEDGTPSTTIALRWGVGRVSNQHMC